VYPAESVARDEDMLQVRTRSQLLPVLPFS
jgi:hypothetical protein